MDQEQEQQQRDAHELAVLELVLSAAERRHEVVDAVWEATDNEDAVQRLREVLDVGEETDPTVVLDMQISRLTKKIRDQITARVNHLREDHQGG